VEELYRITASMTMEATGKSNHPLHPRQRGIK
jgi:hypothetical protein